MKAKWTDKRWLMLCFVFILLLVLVGCSENDVSDEPEPEGVVTEDSAGEIEEEEEELQSEEDSLEVTDSDSLAGLFNQGATINEFSYEMQMKMGGVEQGSMTFYQKGIKTRIEGNSDGQQSTSIMDGEFMYVLMPETNQMMKIPMDAEDAMGTDGGTFTITSYTENLGPGDLYFEGFEEYDGFLCPVAVVEEEELGTTLKIWLHPDYGFPLKMQSTGSIDGDDFEMEIKNFQVGNVSDDVFEVPEGMEVLDMSDMFEGMIDMDELP